MSGTIKRIRGKNAQLFCGSAILLALTISGCTTSGTSLLENVAQDTSLAEDNKTQAQSASASPDLTKDKTAAQSSATSNDKPAETAPEKPASVAAANSISADSALAATNQVVRDKAPAAPEQPSTLAALFGTRSKPTAALAEAAAAEPAAASAANAEKKAKNTTTAPATTDPAAVKTTTPEGAAAQTTITTTGKQYQDTPAADRTSQSAGAAARLFSPGKNSVRGSGRQEAVITAAATPKSTKNYNYTLPGVRANGGVEIRHSNKIFDENDIDLDEDDFSAPVTLASAGGMARLAPNGLRPQHDKVQVSCLKPQLVAMIKRLESHYRKPVVITSGYRSPAHNRSVRGAKRSLHMSCAAADLQIPGVSKWEIARHVRSWPVRGGVGTYCHTESVHIDIGPERDWNWRCRRG